MHCRKREFKHFNNIRTRSSRIIIGLVVTMDSTDMAVTTLGMVVKGYSKKIYCRDDGGYGGYG